MPIPEPPVGDSTRLSFQSEVGDYIGQGRTELYRYTSGYWRVRIDSLHRVIEVAANGPDFAWNWNLHLQAAAGDTLAPCTYEGATRWPFQAPGEPGLDFTGEGRGCNVSRGSFVITGLILSADTVVRYLRATFEQHCENASAALLGTVVIVANAWR